MSAKKPDEKGKIRKLIEEYNEDADRERLLNQVISVPIVTITDQLNATVVEDWLGFVTDDLTLTFDRTIWTMSKPSARKGWEIEDWDGNNDTINIDLTTENIPWEKLLEIFCFDSPTDLLDLLEVNCAFEERVFALMADLSEGDSASDIVTDPILSEWMKRFD
jgi:hypothetical protein